MYEIMGKLGTSEKPKFDLITASKTKKYKIITAVVLVLGVLLLVGGILLRYTLTSAVTPNALSIMEKSLSGLSGTGPTNYTCTISQDECFVLSTTTPQDRALANPIKFNFDDNIKPYIEVRDKSNSYAISSSHYQGKFYLHVSDNAPEFVQNTYGEQVRPTGYLTITCGSKVLRIKLTYHKA